MVETHLANAMDALAAYKLRIQEPTSDGAEILADPDVRPLMEWRVVYRSGGDAPCSTLAEAQGTADRLSRNYPRDCPYSVIERTLATGVERIVATYPPQDPSDITGAA